MQEALWIESRGHRMLGLMEYKSEEVKGRNLVVLIHGFTGTKVEPHRMYVKLSRMLSDMNFTVLRFDFVGSGDSEGESDYMTISGEIEDAINAVNYCRRNFGIDKLFILGYSMGGCVAAYTASKVENDGLVLWSPVSNPFWNFFHLLGEEKFMKGMEGKDVDFLGDIVCSNFFSELNSLNPVKAIESYEKPIQIIHGTKDVDVLPLNSYAYSKGSRNCVNHFIDGADHIYSSKEWEKELLKTTTEFLSQLL